MDPWYWAPISLAALGLARQVYTTWQYDEFSTLAGLLVLAAISWTAWLWISHEPASWSSPPAPTGPQCTVKALEQVYDAAQKHDVAAWVCIGWGQ